MTAAREALDERVAAERASELSIVQLGTCSWEPVWKDGCAAGAGGSWEIQAEAEALVTPAPAETLLHALAWDQCDTEERGTVQETQ